MKPDDEAYVPNAHERLRERERMILGQIQTPRREVVRGMLTLLLIAMTGVGAAIFWAWVTLKVRLWLFR